MVRGVLSLRCPIPPGVRRLRARLGPVEALVPEVPSEPMPKTDGVNDESPARPTACRLRFEVNPRMRIDAAMRNSSCGRRRCQAVEFEASAQFLGGRLMAISDICSRSG
jgi:hypothetical protein